jgi:hypothetical protein
MTCVSAEKSPERLACEDIERQVLEAAASKLKKQHANSVYMQAWKRAAKLIRAMKP